MGYTESCDNIKKGQTILQLGVGGGVKAGCNIWKVISQTGCPWMTSTTSALNLSNLQPVSPEKALRDIKDERAQHNTWEHLAGNPINGEQNVMQNDRLIWTKRKWRFVPTSILTTIPLHIASLQRQICHVASLLETSVMRLWTKGLPISRRVPHVKKKTWHIEEEDEEDEEEEVPDPKPDAWNKFILC